MSFRSNLWISAVALGALTVPVFAANTPAPPTPPVTPPTMTRTFLFPATGFSAASESVRISVVNIAATSGKGTAASCNGNISFADATGKPLGTTPFTNIGTGEIATADYSVNSSLGGRSELQGSVQVTITPAAMTPCSLLLTLEVYDSQSKVTHALVTTAVEEPISAEAAIGHGR